MNCSDADRSVYPAVYVIRIRHAHNQQSHIYPKYWGTLIPYPTDPKKKVHFTTCRCAMSKN